MMRFQVLFRKDGLRFSLPATADLCTAIEKHRAAMDCLGREEAAQMREAMSAELRMWRKRNRDPNMLALLRHAIAGVTDHHADATSTSTFSPVQTTEESARLPPSPEPQQPQGRATPRPATPRMTISLATLKRRRSQSRVREPPRRRVRRRQWPGAAVVEDPGNHTSSNTTHDTQVTKTATTPPPPPQPHPATTSRRQSQVPTSATTPRRQSQKGVHFATGAESCSICCAEQIDGSKMVRLACNHGWYCLDCMARFAQSRLEVGAVELTCPECSNAIAEHDLRKMVPAETVERLLQRSIERAVSCDANLKACPTPGCPMRVALEDGASARLSCPLCKKTSCVRCGAQPWHRSMSCEEYAKKPRPPTKSTGRGRGAAAAAKAAQSNEEALHKWMAETGTRQCPTCGMAVSKQNLGQQQTQRSECHKMMCRNCNCRFCFKCLAILTASFSCGCTSELHGFINPKSGRRISQRFRPKSENSKKRGAGGNSQQGGSE